VLGRAPAIEASHGPAWIPDQVRDDDGGGSPSPQPERSPLTGFPGDVLGPFLLVNAIMLALLLFMDIVFRLAMPMLIEPMGS
jgi:hypothetical protein